MRRDMDKRVRMTHPKLPDREIWVRPAGVKARERAGWRVGATPRKTTTAGAAETTKKEN
jgi:hypothetical protein